MTGHCRIRFKVDGPYSSTDNGGLNLPQSKTAYRAGVDAKLEVIDLNG